MIESLSVFEQFLVIIAGTAGAIVSGIILFHYKKKSECFTALKNQSVSHTNDIDIIKRTLIVLAKMIDTQTNHAHDDAHSELEALTKELLTKNV